MLNHPAKDSSDQSIFQKLVRLSRQASSMPHRGYRRSSPSAILGTRPCVTRAWPTGLSSARRKTNKVDSLAHGLIKHSRTQSRLPGFRRSDLRAFLRERSEDAGCLGEATRQISCSLVPQGGNGMRFVLFRFNRKKYGDSIGGAGAAMASSQGAVASPIEQHSKASSEVVIGVDPAPDSSEFRILLTCLLDDLEPAVQLRLTELLKEDISWDLLLDMAAWHGVSTLLAMRLIGNSAVPPTISDLLRKSVLSNCARNVFLSAELKNISTALATNGISYIPYKGTVLSQYLYGSMESRSVCDIDLIVRPENVHQTISCLEGLGFEDGFGLSPSQRVTAIRYGFEYSFIRGGVFVDLHWRLVQNFCWPSLDMDCVWKSLVPFSFFGGQVDIFSPEFMLVALCIHSAQHDWMELKMFADIAKLLSLHHNLDWQMIRSLTADSHSRRSVLVALSLTHTHLGAFLPPQVINEIARDRQVSRVTNRVHSTIWPSRNHPMPVRSDMRWLLFRTKGERWIDRWRYISCVALGPTVADFWSIEIPPSLAWLYFAVRPLRIIFIRLRRPDHSAVL